MTTSQLLRTAYSISFALRFFSLARAQIVQAFLSTTFFSSNEKCAAEMLCKTRILKTVNVPSLYAQMSLQQCSVVYWQVSHELFPNFE